MTDERRARLDSLGFVWDAEGEVRDAQREAWNERCRQLAEFRHQHGHVNVPRDYGPLGNWVYTQRRGVGMTDERRARLDSLGFVWNLRAAAWNENFRQLAEFRSIHACKCAAGLWPTWALGGQSTFRSRCDG